MKCLVIGAGNAGRPAAKILNYTGIDVVVTDQKSIDNFPDFVRNILLEMESSGITLKLGPDSVEDYNDFDLAYISPTVPLNSPIRKELTKNNVKIVKDHYIGELINNEINIDVIGITGSVGKTSTTLTISEIFKQAGYKVWTCSSQMADLLSEVIIDGIIQGHHLKNDIAILELPHGTLRLLSKLEVKLGIITNIYPEHLTEFEWSMEKYVERKSLILDMCENLIVNTQCQEYMDKLECYNNIIWYCTNDSKIKNPCNVNGELIDSKLKIKYDFSDIKGEFETNFKLFLYYIENAVGAATAALKYGIDKKSIINALSKFNGVPGRMEYLGNFCDREVYLDAAHLPEVLQTSLEFFKGKPLVIVIDNPDGITVRDKIAIGKILGDYSKAIIVSGFNESIKKLDMSAAEEVIKGAKNSDAVKVAVKDMKTAAELSVKYSVPGDIILHVGPGAISAYHQVKQSMINGIKDGCAKNE
ncbi:MAG: Mur ligase family protein [Methanobacteriaceae archaeon]|nr:Mur ligase family protein [Methanobacteriaceae archaeon]